MTIKKRKKINSSIGILLKLISIILVFYVGVSVGMKIMKDEYNKLNLINTYFFANPILVKEDNTINVKDDTRLYVTGELKRGVCWEIK